MRVGVDVGGTFTALAALAENGTIEVRKVVTTPDDPAVGLFRALDALSPVPIDVLIHGTTIATNALLERRGARIALVTTKGFEDLLWLRRQDRAALYDLTRDHPPPLVARSDVVAVPERAGPDGVLDPLGEGAAVGLRELLTLDMGGTSADASLVTGGTPLGDGGGSVAGLVVALPAVLIETVSAGGGSIARLDDGGALKVGPESAGAVPGPACYGRGGDRPTVTDACLALRWLDAQHRLADAVRLDRDAGEVALRSLGSVGGKTDPAAIAAGVVAVAAAVMARALKRVSVARGLDPRQMALLPFGGAGPLFGCQLAEALGMRTIVIPPHPGALSALGLAAAAERVDLLASFHRSLNGLSSRDLGNAFAPLLTEGRSQVPDGTVLRYADCRFAGQGYEVTVPITGDDPQRIGDAFLVEHRARFGHAGSDRSVEIVNLRVVALREGPLPRFADPRRVVQRPGASRPITVRGVRVSASVWALDELAAGVTIAGPAILAGRNATALVEPGWRGTVHPCGAVLVEHT